MNDKQRKEIVEYGKKEPTFYDWSRNYYTTIGRGYDFFQDYLERFLVEGMKVLDIGCGNGKTLSRIANRVGKGYGIELNEKRYKMALENNENNENIEIIKQDALKPFEIGEEIDLVFSERGPIGKRNINYIKRILKKGGILLVEVIGEQDERVFKEIMGRGQGYEEWDEKSTETKIKEVLREKGFKRIKINNHFWLQYYKNIVGLAKNHFTSPAIDLKTSEEDLRKLEEVEKRLKTERGIKLLRHHLVYKATLLS